MSVYVSGHEESRATGVVFVTIPEGLRTALAALRDAGYSVKQGEGSVLAAWKPDREGGVIRPPDYGAFMERLTVQRERAETRSPNSRERRRSLARLNRGA